MTQPPLPGLGGWTPPDDHARALRDRIALKLVQAEPRLHNPIGLADQLMPYVEEYIHGLELRRQR